MRLVNTKAHALIDYLLCILLIFSPFFFGFESNSTAGHTCVAGGLLVLCLALVTRFEFSLFKIVPLKAHMQIDFVSGLLLSVSPVLFDFHKTVFKPHLVFGLTQMVIAVITDRVLYRTFKQSQEERMVRTRSRKDDQSN